MKVVICSINMEKIVRIVSNFEEKEEQEKRIGTRRRGIINPTKGGIVGGRRAPK
jgi:hypothetical protein